MPAPRSGPSSVGHKLRVTAVVLTACAAGAATAAFAATSNSPRTGHDDTSTTGTATTGTTETTTTGTTTTGTTETTTTGTTTTPPATGVPRAPRITGIEVASTAGGKLRLRTEVAARGAKVTSVRIRYRAVSYKARKQGGRWVRTVTARGGDRKDSVIRLRVTACAGSRCSVKNGRDTA